jgi:serine/threonine protein kinase
MSPELLLESNYGVETDIWSLGILCLELANMERPFKENGIEEMQKLAKEKNMNLRLEGDWSAEFKDFVN